MERIDDLLQSAKGEECQYDWLWGFELGYQGTEAISMQEVIEAVEVLKNEKAAVLDEVMG